VGQVRTPAGRIKNVWDIEISVYSQREMFTGNRAAASAVIFVSGRSQIHISTESQAHGNPALVDRL
jgi:hypothetical protein